MFTSNPCQNRRARTLQRTSEVAQKLWGAVHTPPPPGGGGSGSGYWIIYQSPHLQETTFDTLKGLGRGVSKHRLKEKNKLLFTKDAHPRAHTCHVIREAVYQQIKQTSFAKIKNKSNCPQPAPVWAAEQAILASVDNTTGSMERALQCWVRGFPGGPVVKAPSFHCRWYEFDPWAGN